MTADELIHTMRAILLCPLDAGLKLRSLTAALDIYDRPMQKPTCDNCGHAIDEDERRDIYVHGGRHEPSYSESGCVYCDGSRDEMLKNAHWETLISEEREA